METIIDLIKIAFVRLHYMVHRETIVSTDILKISKYSKLVFIFEFSGSKIIFQDLQNSKVVKIKYDNKTGTLVCPETCNEEVEEIINTINVSFDKIAVCESVLRKGILAYEDDIINHIIGYYSNVSYSEYLIDEFCTYIPKSYSIKRTKYGLSAVKYHKTEEICMYVSVGEQVSVYIVLHKPHEDPIILYKDLFIVKNYRLYSTDLSGQLYPSNVREIVNNCLAEA